MATNDRDACLVFFFFFNPPDFYKVFLGFYTVNFPCFKGNRVNIQGVLTTRKSVHKFWRNLEFSFMTRITLKLFLNTGALVPCVPIPRAPKNYIEPP